MENKVNDLRSALALLKSIPGQLIETDAEVEPMAELSGVYRHVGAGGTVMRPTKEGPASDQCWLIKVTAVTHRKDPIMQTCIGPSEEHVSMAGIPTEASIYGMIEKAMPGRLKNVYCASPGGGKYMAVLQFQKLSPSDEGRQRQAALLAFSAFSELKHVFIVDEDVDCFDINDVLWAMNTRFQGDADIITIPGVRCHQLDPSNDPSCSASIRDHGIACKTIFDCTVPYDQKERFVRARFMDVEPEK